MYPISSPLGGIFPTEKLNNSRVSFKKKKKLTKASDNIAVGGSFSFGQVFQLNI